MNDENGKYYSKHIVNISIQAPTSIVFLVTDIKKYVILIKPCKKIILLYVLNIINTAL